MGWWVVGGGFIFSWNVGGEVLSCEFVDGGRGVAGEWIDDGRVKDGRGEEARASMLPT